MGSWAVPGNPEESPGFARLAADLWERATLELELAATALELASDEAAEEIQP